MKFLTILVSLLFLTACNTKDKNGYLAMAKKNDNSGIEFSQEHPGKKLLENNCYACHNPETSKEAMIAPPMIAIKMHYISDDTSKEDFVNAMVVWAKNPSEEKSKMPGAVKKFGLMPYQFYPENTIRQIADYMFDNQVEEPKWFQAHNKKMHGSRSGMKGKGDK